LEYEVACGPCNPGVHYTPPKQTKPEDHSKEDEINGINDSTLHCPPCSQEQCDSDLNRCPVFKRSFVCTKGTSKGACSGDPQFWSVEEQCGKNCFYLFGFM
jgi:hypothetical protein